MMLSRLYLKVRELWISELGFCQEWDMRFISILRLMRYTAMLSYHKGHDVYKDWSESLKALHAKREPAVPLWMSYEI